LVPHSQPRFKVFTDKEAQQSLVHISFKMENVPVSTFEEYVDRLREDLFHTAMNSRFFRMGRRQDPPFYNAQVKIVLVVYADVPALCVDSTCLILSTCILATVRQAGPLDGKGQLCLCRLAQNRSLQPLGALCSQRSPRRITPCVPWRYFYLQRLHGHCFIENCAIDPQSVMCMLHKSLSNVQWSLQSR